MSQQKKAKKVGRPRLARSEAKSQIVPVRFSADELRSYESATQKSDCDTLSAWIRATLNEKVNR